MNEIDSKMSNLPDEPNLSLRVSLFNGILISAATIHVGKSKPSKKSKSWMTPHMRAKIRTRNRLRRTIHQNRQEWIDACRETTEAINKAKTESWKDLLQSTMSNSDRPNMWKIVQGLNGTPDANSPNEVMSRTKSCPEVMSLCQGQQTQHVTSRPRHQPTFEEAFQHTICFQ